MNWFSKEKGTKGAGKGSVREGSIEDQMKIAAKNKKKREAEAKKRAQEQALDDWENHKADGGTAKACKMDALKSIMGGKKPKMIQATISAKNPKALKAGAEKVEEVAESMGAPEMEDEKSESKGKKSKSDLIKQLRALLS